MQTGKNQMVDYHNLLKKENELLKAKLLAFEESLTPSAETKGYFIGEFSFDEEVFNGEDKYVTQRCTVPWTTIKEIMKAIKIRAIRVVK